MVPLLVFLFVAGMLSVMQLMLENPIILVERFWPGWGWLEIFIVASYGAVVAFNMQDPRKVPTWRKWTWTLFSIVFFGQLFLGLAGFEKFLMTGKLHIPVPAMILSGPVFRGQLSIMTLLFLSTVVLSGPAWCSHLCYFGALDGLASGQKWNHQPLKNKSAIKFTLLAAIILVTLILRWFSVPLWLSTGLGLLFGTVGVMLIVFVSRKRGKMVHCVLYCPIGTIVQYLKYLNPFRLEIDQSCTLCMKCSSVCKYDALNVLDIKHGKPGKSCTLCGDCLQSCQVNSFQYKFLKLNPAHSRNLYLFMTVSLHAVFLALARI